MEVIGAADEFWRLRITRVEATEGLDFEWHEDILYRSPHVTPADEIEQFLVEAVSLDTPDLVQSLACFGEREDAETFLADASDDLADMTRSQFEEAYFAEDSGCDDDSKDEA